MNQANPKATNWARPVGFECWWREWKREERTYLSKWSHNEEVPQALGVELGLCICLLIRMLGEGRKRRNDLPGKGDSVSWAAGLELATCIIFIRISE